MMFFSFEFVNMKYRFFYLLISFFFMGCAQIPSQKSQQNNSWDMQQQSLVALSDWSLTAKLAVITPKERNSVNMFWQQSQQGFHINLTTFLGLTVLDVKKEGGKTTIIDNNGKSYSSRNTEALIEELSGIVLPIEQLQQWIKGNPEDAHYKLDENYQVIHLVSSDEEDDKWSINYSGYHTTNNINLPHRLQLKRKDLRLKIARSNWNVK